MGSENIDNNEMRRIENMFEVISEKLVTMDGKLEQIMKENEGIKHENAKLKNHVMAQDRKIVWLEREIRRKNIVIRGVEDKDKEKGEETMCEMITVIQKLGVQINKEEIDEVKRIGSYKEDRQRPILAKLTSGNKKWEILNNTTKLKGTNIWIDEDYTKETMEERKRLIPIMKEAREQGHRAYLKHNKLVIDNEVYETKGEGEEKSEKERENTQEGPSISNKRSVSVRSPNSGLEEQLRKMTRTSKNL